MNYEKKYKDALERAKEKYAMFEGMKQGDVLEDVFPELKESEDGSIRKAIHIYLDWLDGRKGYEPKGEYSIRDMIAWIEKQGEHKPNDKKGMNLVEEKMTPFQKKVFCIIDTTIEDEQGLKQVCDELLSLASNEIKQKLDWSEEDEKMFNSALWHIKNSCGNQGKNSGEFEVYNWLKTIKYRYLPQPKHEWSEEDEETLKIIDRDLQEFYSRRKDQAGSPLFESQMQNIRWLKSLNNRYTWKPSGWQMEALKEAVDEHFDIDGGVLWHLYQDLKKLREE